MGDGAGSLRRRALGRPVPGGAGPLATEEGTASPAGRQAGRR